MAYFLQSKTSGETKTYTFEPELPGLDSIQSFSLTPSGVVIVLSAAIESGIVFSVSGGTPGETASIAVSFLTDGGDALEETIYLPIVASHAITADSARQYVSFALRKVTGPRRAPTDSELDDGLERLNALVAKMRACGADIGAPYPLTADSVIYCPDWAVSALRFNLLVGCIGLYGLEPTAYEYDAARRGMQLVKHKGLPQNRASEFF